MSFNLNDIISITRVGTEIITLSMPLNLDDLKKIVEMFAHIATIFIAIFAGFTFFKGLIEYIKQGSIKRSDYFIQMRNKLRDNESLKKVCEALEKYDPEKNNKIIKELKFTEKRDFLDFFEEIALMMNSNIIKKKVAYYIFSYHAIRCWENDDFWGKDDNKVNKDSIYWRLFREFAITMKKIEEKSKKIEKICNNIEEKSKFCKIFAKPVLYFILNFSFRIGCIKI